MRSQWAAVYVGTQLNAVGPFLGPGRPDESPVKRWRKVSAMVCSCLGCIVIKRLLATFDWGGTEYVTQMSSMRP